MTTRLLIAVHDVREPPLIPGDSPRWSRVATHVSAEESSLPADPTLTEVFRFDPPTPGVGSLKRGTPTSYQGVSLNSVTGAVRFAVYSAIVAGPADIAPVQDALETLGVADTNSWLVAYETEAAA